MGKSPWENPIIIDNPYTWWLEQDFPTSTFHDRPPKNPPSDGMCWEPAAVSWKLRLRPVPKFRKINGSRESGQVVSITGSDMGPG